jgi:NitT/TauT family transport system substrate-binding protein
MEAALRAGRVDAIPLSEPFWTFAEARGDLRLVSDFLGDAYATLEIAAWFTTREWIERNPGAARLVHEIFREAIRFIEDPANEPRVRDVIARYTSIDSATARRIRLPAFQAHFTLSHLDEVIADMRAHEFLRTPLATRDLLAGSPIEAR